MKKVLLVISTHILLSAGCRRESLTITQPPATGTAKVVFRNDSSLLGKEVTVPTQVIHTLDLPIGTASGVVILGGYFQCAPLGVTLPSRDIKNFVMRIKDGATTVYTTPVFANVANGANSLPQLSLNLLQTKTYRIEFLYDILASATDGSGVTDGCRVGLELYYSHRASPYDTIVFTNSQTMTFVKTPVIPQATLETTTDHNLLPKQVVAQQSERGTVSWLAKATGGDIPITEQTYRIEGSARSVVTALKLYDSTSGTFIEQVAVVNNTAVFTKAHTVSSGKTVRFSVRAVVGSVSASVSSLPFTVVRDKITYQLPTSAVYTDDVDIVSNPIHVFKTLFTITHIPVTTPLANGRMELYRFAISGTTAHKQFTFEITLNDLGVNDTLSLKDFDLHENGVSVKSRLRFTDAQGVLDTVFTESDSKLYITYTQGSGETQINGTVTFSFFATLGGYRGPADGDGIAIRLLGDQSAPPEAYKYLNNGGLMFGNAKLFSSPFGTASAQSSHFLLSDMSAVPHNGQFNTSTNDWTNGYHFFSFLPYQYFN